MLLALLLAQAAAPACPATPAPLPAEYTGWTVGAPVTAAPGAEGAPTLAIGQGAAVTLQPGTALKLPVALRKPAAHGGAVAFTVASAGRYRVALGAGLWTDVIANGAVVPSASHGHGPDCSALKKFVEWTLAPGRYLLQLSGEPATAQVEILKVG